MVFARFQVLIDTKGREAMLLVSAIYVTLPYQLIDNFLEAKDIYGRDVEAMEARFEVRVA